MATMDEDVLVLAKEHVLQGCNKYEGLLSSTSSLDVLINDVYMRCRPNAQDYDNRRDLISIFNAIARETSSHHNPVAVGFGSFIMDMFDDESDLDLSILFGKRKYGKQYKVKTEYLQKIADKLYDLQEKGHVTNIEPIFTARVPVLKVTDCGTGIECDISVRNVDGIAKSHLLHMISAIDERFQKLCVLMKAWAKAHHINSSKDGTLGSISLVLLAAFHLQTRDPPILPPLHEICKGGVKLEAVKEIIPNFLDYGKENKESLAELFVSLLIVLQSVETLWPKGLCASTYMGSWACKPWKAVHGYMNIEDIIDKSQNTARAVKSVKKMNKIYSCIRKSLQQIQSYISGDTDKAMLKNWLFGPDRPPKENKSINAHHPFLQKSIIGNPIETKKRKRVSMKPDESVQEKRVIVSMATTEEDLLVLAKKYELQVCNKYEGMLSSITALDVPLNDVYTSRRPNAQDYDNRRDLIRIFNAIASEIYGSDTCPVVVGFGSFIMDMFDDKSDLDLSIQFSDKKNRSRRRKKPKHLQRFADKLYALQESGHVRNIQPIFTARVPVLKVTDCGTGIECDLSVKNFQGVANSHLLHMISAIDERFQKLCVLMKAWAKAHHINSSKDGTLSSISLVLLVAFHLQTRDPPILPPLHEIFKGGKKPEAVEKIIPSFLDYGKENKESLAELFVSLLIVLESVETLWPKGLCASTYNGSWTCKPWNAFHGYINIEDFTDKSQNTARAVRSEEKMNKIYSCIRNALQQIQSYANGNMDEVKLKNWLFGPDPPPRENKGVINAYHHSSLQKQVLQNPIDQKKRKRVSKEPQESSLRSSKSSRQTAAETDRSEDTCGATSDPVPEFFPLNQVPTGVTPLSQGPTGVRLEFLPLSQGPIGVGPEFRLLSQGPIGVRPEFRPLSQGPTGVRSEFRPLGQGPTDVRPEFRPLSQGLTGDRPKTWRCGPTGVRPEFRPLSQGPTGVKPEFRPLSQGPTGVKPEFYPLSQGPTRGPTGDGPETWRCDRPEFRPLNQDPTGVRLEFLPLSRGPTGVTAEFCPLNQGPTGDRPEFRPLNQGPTRDRPELRLRSQGPTTGGPTGDRPETWRCGPTGVRLEFCSLSQDPTGVRQEFQGPTGVRPELRLLSQGPTGYRPETWRCGPTGVRLEFHSLSQDPTGVRPEFHPLNQGPTGVRPEFRPLSQGPTRDRPEFRSLSQGPTRDRTEFRPLSQGLAGDRPETWRCDGDPRISSAAPYIHHPPHVQVPPPKLYTPPVGFGGSYGPQQPLIPHNSSPFPRGSHALDYRNFVAPVTHANSLKNVLHHHLQPNHCQNPRGADGARPHYYF